MQIFEWRGFDNRKDAAAYALLTGLPVGKSVSCKVAKYRYFVGRFSPYHYTEFTPRPSKEPMDTVIKPNDIIDQILTIAAELTPVAERLGRACGVAWRDMLTNRDHLSAHHAYLVVPHWLTSNGAGQIEAAAEAIREALTPGRTCLQLHYDLQEVQDARAALEPLLAELRKVPV
jgi:hypothetical protein